MVVSSTLVNVTDDAEVRLVALLAESAPTGLLGPSFQADCQASIDAGEAGALLTTVLADTGAIAALLTLDADEAVGAVSILAALLERTGRSALDLASAVVAATSVPDKEDRKIALLSTLYNMRSDAGEKVELLRLMVELAGKSANKDALLAPTGTIGSLLSCPGDEELSSPLSASSSSYAPLNRRCLDDAQPPLVALMDSWQVSHKDRQPIYRTVASLLPDADVRKQRFLLLLVASYSGSDGGSDQAVEVAVEAAVGAVRDPVSLFVMQRNLLTYPAVQALQAKHPLLLGLLRVFQEGQLVDYNSFLQANGGADRVLKNWALDAAACSRNMRVLSLCALAADRGEEIPYSLVAKALQLPSVSDVESSVIDAVSTGLLQAKMDQLQQKVIVETSVVRKFDTEQWKALQTRLRLWKQSVGSVLAALKESQLSAAAAAAAGAGPKK
jgi:PCI domain/eIF3 subunit M, C-terminal helix